MGDGNGIKIFFTLCLISIGSLVSTAAPADDKNTLAQAVKGFLQRCDGKSKETLSQSCANEWAALHRIQDALHLSNEDVNGQLATARGGLIAGAHPWW